MRLSGLHFLITYKCNCSCAHCFLSCGPDKEGVMSLSQIKGYIDQAKDTPSVNYFFIEGGEPFLYPKIALEAVKYATEKGYWIGILSNGFWAKTLEKGISVLKPFKDAGLGEIGISTDSFHQAKVPLLSAVNAVMAAEKLDIPVSIMATSNSKKEITQLQRCVAEMGAKSKVWGSSIRGRGRGALICEGKPAKWQKLTKCAENLADPGRVHIGPEGAVHVCQNLVLGRDDQVIEQLIKGGPAALTKWAIEKHGFQPKDTYRQDCQLCNDVRCFLASIG